MERCLLKQSAASLTRMSALRKSIQRIPGNARFNSTSAGDTMSWSEYLTMRKSRHRWQNISTIPASLIGLFGGATYFASLEADPLKPILGVDPFMFYGACTAACMGLGFVVGPTMGTAAWRLVNGKSLQSFDARDGQFFQRIAKNRVDVSLQSPTSPVPDYYGEKIGSVQQYRTWLRDQAKYRKKALFPED